MERSELIKLIDWDVVMKASRSAGGHTDIMQKVFFTTSSVILASWVENDYQGSEVFAYLFKDGYVVIIQDSFGSCSGCDSWEGASDQDAKSLITTLVDSAKIFKNISEAISYIENPDSSDYYSQYLVNIKKNLEKYNKMYIKIVLEEAPLYINDKDDIVKFMSNMVLGVIK